MIRPTAYWLVGRPYAEPQAAGFHSPIAASRGPVALVAQTM